MVRTRLYALAFPVVLALVGLVSVVPVASAHTITPQAPKSEPPSGWCGSLPAGIQMISGTTGGWLSIPTTTVAVDSCTLDLLRRKGDPAQVAVLADSTVPGLVIPIFKQTVIAHASDLWQADQACPHPERGVSFTLVFLILREKSTCYACFQPSQVARREKMLLRQEKVLMTGWLPDKNGKRGNQTSPRFLKGVEQEKSGRKRLRGSDEGRFERNLCLLQALAKAIGLANELKNMCFVR